VDTDPDPRGPKTCRSGSGTLIGGAKFFIFLGINYMPHIIYDWGK
jgi:hypothetical protein